MKSIIPFDCQVEVSQGFAKIHKQYFGKGPRNVDLVEKQDLIIIKAQGILTRLEKNLLRVENGKSKVSEIRKIVFEQCKCDMITQFRNATGLKIKNLVFQLFEEHDDLLIIIFL